MKRTTIVALLIAATTLSILQPEAQGRRRYLDPNTARFTQRDPLDYVDGNNLYEDRQNNPVNRTDSTGTQVKIAAGVWNHDTSSTIKARPNSSIAGLLSELSKRYGASVGWRPETAGFGVSEIGGIMLYDTGRRMNASDVSSDASAVRWMLRNNSKTYSFATVDSFRRNLPATIALVKAEARSLPRMIAADNAAISRGAETIARGPMLVKAMQESLADARQAQIDLARLLGVMSRAGSSGGRLSSSDEKFLANAYWSALESQSNVLSPQAAAPALSDSPLAYAINSLPFKARQSLTGFLHLNRLGDARMDAYWRLRKEFGQSQSMDLVLMGFDGRNLARAVLRGRAPIGDDQLEARLAILKRYQGKRFGGTAALLQMTGIRNITSQEYEEYFDLRKIAATVAATGSVCAIQMGLTRGIVNRGGAFSRLDSAKRPGEVAHHMPQNAYNREIGRSRSRGPAMGMTTKDHSLTRTFRGRGKATMRLDAGLSARQRMAKDIWDIKKLFGRKYNKGIKGMLEYAKALKEYMK